MKAQKSEKLEYQRVVIHSQNFKCGNIHKARKVGKIWISKRQNPKYSRFAYAVASKENEIITEILEKICLEVGTAPICLFFDGFIIEAKTNET